MGEGNSPEKLYVPPGFSKVQRRIFGVGLRGPAGENFGAATRDEFRGKTRLKLFFENNLFSSNFQAFLVLPGGGVITLTPSG